MDVDPRLQWANSAIIRGDQRHPQLMQLMRQPVVDDGRDARVAGEHFVDALRGRVAFVGGQNVGLEQPANLRQAAGEIANQLLRLASARRGSVCSPTNLSSAPTCSTRSRHESSSVWPT